MASDHERIYLEPEVGADPDTGRCWCEHAAPGAGDDRTWTEYVRADLHSTAINERDAARADALAAASREEEARAEAGRLRAIAEHFCLRVERGEVRSVRTYNEFKAALAQEPRHD